MASNPITEMVLRNKSVPDKIILFAYISILTACFKQQLHEES